MSEHNFDIDRLRAPILNQRLRRAGYRADCETDEELLFMARPVSDVSQVEDLADEIIRQRSFPKKPPGYYLNDEEKLIFTRRPGPIAYLRANPSLAGLTFSETLAEKEALEAYVTKKADPITRMENLIKIVETETENASHWQRDDCEQLLRQLKEELADWTDELVEEHRWEWNETLRKE